MSEKGTFLKVTIQPFMFKNKHNLIEMLLMLLLNLSVNRNNIEVNYHKVPNVMGTILWNQVKTKPQA